jgi:hypothetical protein
MATTTNYGWTTPDDTALVKDGAAAIRTLGTSVDTTTKNLNPSTTLGDIEYRSSTANTNTRLGIGTTGQVLAVSGGVPAWTTSSSGSMTLLSTTTLSGASTTISSIDQTYKTLLFYVFGMTNATGNSVGGFQPNSVELFTGCYLGTTTLYNTNADGINFCWNSDQILRTSNNNAYTVQIENYAGASLNKNVYVHGHYVNTSSATRGYISFGTFVSSTAISSLKFQNFGGDWSSGTVQIYGVK